MTAPFWRVMARREFLTSFCMGFSSGAPLLITLTLIQAWLTDAGADLTAIGLMAAVGLPYSLKFLWAPWLDYCDPPLAARLGRRRGWLLISQLDLMLGLFILSYLNPENLLLVALMAFLIAFASATQDVIVDAYRRDDLADAELGLGSACYQWGYRLGMLAVSGGGLILADSLGWPWVFRLAALLMLTGPLTLLFSPEPKIARPEAPSSLAQTVAEPLRDFFRRPAPWLILGFIFFYKFGDQLAGSLTTTYYMRLGYSKEAIGWVVKIFGVWATLAGVALGGAGVYKFGQKSALWLFGFLQMASTFGFAVLYYLPLHPASLALVISQENLAAGAGSSAFVAFMAARTNRSFSATQYALLSALMALPRTLLSAPAGFLAKAVDWPAFFVLSALCALPGFVILHALSRRQVFDDFEQA